MKLLPSRPARLIVAVSACLFTVLAVPVSDDGSSAHAWFSRRGRAERDSEKPLTVKQAKGIAGRLVDALLADTFFKREELALRVTVALMNLDVGAKELTDSEFTDMVLNNLLNRSEVSVVNQEPQFSAENLNFKLVSYDDEWTARNRGLMLGAEFVVTGRITETLVNDPKGSVYKTYDGRLALQDIRTNEVIIERRVSHSRKKVKKRRR